MLTIAFSPHTLEERFEGGFPGWRPPYFTAQHPTPIGIVEDSEVGPVRIASNRGSVWENGRPLGMWGDDLQH